MPGSFCYVVAGRRQVSDMVPEAGTMDALVTTVFGVACAVRALYGTGVELPSVELLYAGPATTAAMDTFIRYSLGRELLT
jgi:hypothetical protein